MPEITWCQLGCQLLVILWENSLVGMDGVSGLSVTCSRCVKYHGKQRSRKYLGLEGGGIQAKGSEDIFTGGIAGTILSIHCCRFVHENIRYSILDRTNVSC